jgi:hypothetical protein
MEVDQRRRVARSEELEGVDHWQVPDAQERALVVHPEVHRAPADVQRPEETRWQDAAVEVVYLRPRTGVEKVDSYQGARRQLLLPVMAGDAPFVALDEHGVIVESIARFKGLEAEVVLLALTDAILREGTSLKAHAYVGLSRARSLLIVVGSKAIRRALQWPASL